MNIRQCSDLMCCGGTNVYPRGLSIYPPGVKTQAYLGCNVDSRGIYRLPDKATCLKAYSRCDPPSACIPCFEQNIMWRDYINKHPDTATLPRFHPPPIVTCPVCPCPRDALCMARCFAFPDPGSCEQDKLVVGRCHSGELSCTKASCHGYKDNSLGHCFPPCPHPNKNCRRGIFSMMP